MQALKLNELDNDENKFELLNLNDGVIQLIFDKNLVLKSFNDSFSKLMKYQQKDLEERSIIEFITSSISSVEEYKKNLQTFGKIEIQFKNSNGRNIYFIGNTEPYKNDDTHYHFIGIDVTELKAELQVRIDIMNQTSIVSEANLRGDILNINEKFINTSKYSKDELIGKPHNTTRHPDMSKDVFKSMWSTIGSGQIFRGIVKNRAKDGTPYYVDAVIAPILGENGKPQKYLGVRYDITEAEIERQNMKGILNSIDSTFAYIEFDIEGNVLNCNKLFEKVMGFNLNEIKGTHHRKFCDTNYTNSNDYIQFWTVLKSGQSISETFKRITKSGTEVFLQAVYAPVKDEMGRVIKIIKIATDVTLEKLKNSEFEGKMKAISKAQALIEFSPDGNIIYANELFLNTLGYTLEDIKGKHHKLFCDKEYLRTNEYLEFWQNLASGNFESGQFKRIGKNGKEIWIQASYNPIFDLNGKVFKVVKFAFDITEQVHRKDEFNRVVVSTVNLFNKNVADISSKISKLAQDSQSLGATTEEMNASVEELSASIDSIAQNGKSADSVGKSTQTEANLGTEAISKSIEAMDLINKSSEEISEIVKVISEIASQTNLLAFNAAIEAARAGEHGLGFSVVADEVRKLAERSSQATKDISKLINESVKRVAQGGEISKQAANSFKRIVDGVGKTTQAISEISVAAQEQQTASRDVAQAIQQVAMATEKSALASEEISQATNELAAGAEQLKLAIQKFAS